MLRIKSNDAWLSRLVPFGMNHRSDPHPYRDLLGAVWENKRELSYAWSILKRGVCDGCSLGSYGLHDTVIGGLHLCANRLKLLRLNTMGALAPSAIKDVRRLQALKPEKLRFLGRLAYPMIRWRNDRGFAQIAWPEAFEIIRRAIHDTPPHELGFCAPSCGVTNEVYYVFQKLARALGTNNIGLSSPPCHTNGVSGLKTTLGVGAPTCSLSDLIDTDLLVILDADLANKQFAITKYLKYARKRGTRIIVVKSVREPGLESSGSLSLPSGAAFGSKLVGDIFFDLRVGGEIAFINGVLKTLMEWNRIDREFVARHTNGFDKLASALGQQSWERLEHGSGVARQEMERFAALYGSVSRAVFVYGTGLTRPELGADNVKAVVNLALVRGMLGREKCGIMPIHDRSGLQGGGECGVAPDQFPGGFAVDDESARRFSNLWRHPVSSAPGLTLVQMMEAAREGKLKFLYLLGGNFLDAFADRGVATAALSRVTVRIHQNMVLNPSVLVEGPEAVLVLPAKTRYEQKGGGTLTTNERKICFTPEIPGHSIGDSLPAWEIPTIIGQRSMPNGDLLFPFNDSQSIREEMARVVPIYQGIERLANEGDYLQWGGPQLFKGGTFRGMPGERAFFSALEPPDHIAIERREPLVTERGSNTPAALSPPVEK
jgi:molybdopterin-dependent oxidoreductase alpha subunit